MIYERYRGSDTSKTVPRRLNELKQHEKKMPWKQRIRVLRELLEIEKEPNTRGYLLWRIGHDYLSEERHEDAVGAFLEAKGEFDPLMGTIDGVMDEYCDTLYYVILDHYAAREEIETMAELAMVIVVNLDNTQVSDFQKGYILSRLGYALNMLARKHSLEALRPLVRACYLRWHHIQPEDETCLTLLAYLYFEEGDMAHCRSAVQMCLEVAPAGEVRDRIEAFAREHAREIDPGSGTS